MVLSMRELTLLALHFSIYLNRFVAIPLVNECILIQVGMTYHQMPLKTCYLCRDLIDYSLITL